MAGQIWNPKHLQYVRIAGLGGLSGEALKPGHEFTAWVLVRSSKKKNTIVIFTTDIENYN